MYIDVYLCLFMYMINGYFCIVIYIYIYIYISMYTNVY